MTSKYDDMIKFAESMEMRITDIDLCKTMASLGRIFNPESILDPHSGMGEILYYCDFGHTVDAYTTNKEAITIGRDVDNRINFIYENFLVVDLEKRYDLVISQIPFSYGINPLTKKEEFLDLDYINKILGVIKKDGAFIGLLPARFCYDDYSLTMRETIMNNYSLEMVIELPYEDYQLGNHDLNIVVIRKREQRDNVLIVDYNENIDEIINKYLLGEGEDFFYRKYLKERWNKYYHRNKFNWLNAYQPSKYIILDEVAEILSGAFFSNLKDEGDIIVVNKDNMIRGKLFPTIKDKYIKDKEVSGFREYILKDGDMVINMSMNGNLNIATYDKSMPQMTVPMLYNIIRSENKYFQEFMGTTAGIDFFEDYLRRHIRPPHNRINTADIKKFRIPLFDAEDLNIIDKHYKGTLNEEDVKSRLKRIRNELERNRAEKSKYENIINELEKTVHLKEKEKLQLIKEQKMKIDNLEEEHRENIRIRDELITKININQEDLLNSTEIIKTIVGGLQTSQDDMKTDIKEIKTIGIDNSAKLDLQGELIRDIHSMMTKLYDIQEDILIKLDKALDEDEREKTYIELVDRVWGLINENYNIKRNQDYDKIEEEYIKKFTIDGWNKLDDSTRTYLITSRIVYEDLKFNNKVDFSPVCIALTKALERELYIHLFAKMRTYFQKDKGRNRATLPDGIIYNTRNGTFYQQDKFYSLGKISYILAQSFSDNRISDREKAIKKESLKEFLNSELFKKDSFKDQDIDEYIKELEKDVENIRKNYRNEAAHKDAVDRIKADECYKILIDTERVLIEFINRLAVEN